MPSHGPEKGRRVARGLLTAAGLTGTFAIGAWLSATLVERPAPPPPLVVTPTVTQASAEPEPEPASLPAPPPAAAAAEPPEHPARDLHARDRAAVEPESPAAAPEAEPAAEAPAADPVPEDGTLAEPPPAGNAATEDAAVTATTPATPPAEAPQAEAPQAEAPQAEASQAEAPQAEAPQASSPTPTAPERFTVQVGTFSVPENAERLASTLGRLGFDVYMLDWTDSTGARWRVVRVGKFANEADAAHLLSELRERASQRGDVIRLR